MMHVQRLCQRCAFSEQGGRPLAFLAKAPASNYRKMQCGGTNVTARIPATDLEQALPDIPVAVLLETSEPGIHRNARFP